MGALTSPIARLRLARSPRGFFSLLACSYCLLLVEGPALTAAADAGPPVTAVPPPAANAAAETPAPVPPASEIPRPPAKVPLRVVGARVALQTKVGGQDLLLGLDTCKEGLRLFSSGTSSCTSGRPAAVAEQHQQKQHQQQEHGGAGTREEEAKPVEQQRAGDSPVQRKRLHQPQNCYDPDLSPASMWCLNWHEVCTAFSETPFTCRPSKQHDPKYAAKYARRTAFSYLPLFIEISRCRSFYLSSSVSSPFWISVFSFCLALFLCLLMVYLSLPECPFCLFPVALIHRCCSLLASLSISFPPVCRPLSPCSFLYHKLYRAFAIHAVPSSPSGSGCVFVVADISK